MIFDPTSVEVLCVTLPKDHCVKIPWKYIKVCGYSDVFAKNLKGHWPLDDLWPHIFCGHMCDSTQGSLCPSPMKIHQSMWIQWPFLQKLEPTCEIWVNNNNHKMVLILANLCCLEANSVSNCRKRISKCSYNLFGHRIISFYFIGNKIGVRGIILELFSFYLGFLHLY